MKIEQDNNENQKSAQSLLAQLSDFGLNPQDWQLVNDPWHTHSPALLESKEDNQWRLMGYLQKENGNTTRWQLQDLQLLSI